MRLDDPKTPSIVDTETDRLEHVGLSGKAGDTKALGNLHRSRSFVGSQRLVRTVSDGRSESHDPRDHHGSESGDSSHEDIVHRILRRARGHLSDLGPSTALDRLLTDQSVDERFEILGPVRLRHDAV